MIYYKPVYTLVVTAYLSLFIAFTLSAQNHQKPAYSLGVQSYYGFVWKHAESVGHLSQTHPYGLEINYNQITTGTKEWHKVYRYPEVGYSLGMFNFRNNILGKAIYAITYLDKALLRSQRSALQLKIGTGLVCVTNPYHPEKNFQNTALSSRIMYAMRGEVAYTYQLTPHLQVKSGLTLTHFSNGALKMPNSGINIPALKVGLLYVPNSTAIHPSDADSVGKSAYRYKGIELNFSAAFLIKEVGLPGGRKHPGVVISAYANRRLNRKSALNMGIDGFYSTALKHIINTDPDVDTLRVPDFKRAGMTFGHELYISRVSMLTQIGVYVYMPYQNIDHRIYQRIGLKYYFHKNFFAAAMLKTHFGTADFMEWTIGVRW